MPLQLGAASNLVSIYLEKSITGTGHYIAGTFNGTLSLNGTNITSEAGGLFAVRVDTNNQVIWLAACCE